MPSTPNSFPQMPAKAKQTEGNQAQRSRLGNGLDDGLRSGADAIGLIRKRPAQEFDDAAIIYQLCPAKHRICINPVLGNSFTSVKSNIERNTIVIKEFIDIWTCHSAA